MTISSATQDSYPYQNELTWSRSEKAVADTAFHAALGRELHRKQSKRPTRSGTRRILWDLEYYLTQRRKEIDRKYDYRYSRLTHVFGRLLHERRLSEQELRGLREDELKPIRSSRNFLAETDAIA